RAHQILSTYRPHCSPPELVYFYELQLELIHRMRSRADRRYLRAVLVAASIAGMLTSCGGGSRSADDRAPNFGGLRSATTCAAGPGSRPTSFTLRWKAAVDDTTARTAIAYDIYQSDKSGAESFGRPTYAVPAGATSFKTPPLPGDRPWYF